MITRHGTNARRIAGAVIIGTVMSGLASAAPKGAQTVRWNKHTVSIENSFVMLGVTSDGSFGLHTRDGDPNNPNDNNKDLTYSPYGDTNGLSVKVGQTLYVLDDSDDYVTAPLTKNESANTASMTWEMGGVRLVATYELTTSDSGRADTAKVTYALTNISGGTRTVGLKCGLDTEIGSNDLAKLRTPQGIIQDETGFGLTGTGGSYSYSVPDFWQALERADLGDPGVVAQGTFAGGGATRPDKFVVGQWDGYPPPYGVSDGHTFDYTPDEEPYGDSAVGMWWLDRSISPGQTFNIRILYGLGALTTVSGDLDLSISAPASLGVDGADFDPNPFSVLVQVQNNVGERLTDLPVHLELPPGLALASGTAIQTIPAIDDGEIQSVTYSLRADPAYGGQTRTYTVTVGEGEDYETEAERSVSLPVIPKHITVTYPNGGETFDSGASEQIRWTSTGVTGGVDLAHSADNGASWTSIATDTANDGVYAWQVPLPTAQGAVNRIRVRSHSEPAVVDISDAPFTIRGPVTARLTMSVTPVGAGNTEPATGIHDIELDMLHELTATPNPGWRFDRWTSNGGADVMDDRLAATRYSLSADGAITAHFIAYNEVFPPGGAFPSGWDVPAGADAGWSVSASDASEGSLSLRSDPVGHGGTAAVQVVESFVPGRVSFAFRTSTEGGYDFLRFSIDGQQAGQWSGNRDWEQVSFPIAGGTHTLLWAYEKDGSATGGEDAVWIDEVVLPLQEDDAGWVIQQGGSGDEIGYDIAVDAAGNAYVTGVATGPFAGQTAQGGEDAFVAKIDGSGTLVWVRFLGTAANDQGRGIAVDRQQTIVVTGTTFGDLTGEGSAGQADLFVARYSAAGDLLELVQTGSSGVDVGTDVAVDAAGNPFVTGYTTGDLWGNSNAGAEDAFLMKLGSLTGFDWCVTLGTAGVDQAMEISLDDNDRITIAGYTTGNLPGYVNAGGVDMFAARYTTGAIRQWVRQLGGSANDYSDGLAVDAGSNVYLSGDSNGDLDGTTSAGGYDLFLTCLNENGQRQWTDRAGSPADEVGQALAWSPNGSLFVAGYSYGNIGAEPNLGSADAVLLEFQPGARGPAAVHVLGTSAADAARGLAVTPTGRVYATGQTSAQLPQAVHHGGIDFFVWKLPPVDGAPPVPGLLAINNGDDTTTDPDVTLSVAATDGRGVTAYAVSESAETPAPDAFVQLETPETTFSRVIPFTLSGGDGLKTVYAWFADTAGNISQPADGSIRLDTAAPTDARIVVNDSAPATGDRTVSLMLHAEDTGGIDAFAVASSAAIPVTFTVLPAPETVFHATDVAFQLPAGDGTKTVYAWFRDKAGHISHVVSDSIRLDTEPPTRPEVDIASADGYVSTAELLVSFSSWDATGIASYHLGDTAEIPPVSEFTAVDPTRMVMMVYINPNLFKATDLSFTVGDDTDGPKTVYVTTADSAGNVSETASTTVTKDGTAPEITRFALNGGAPVALTRRLEISMTATDPNGVAHIYYAFYTVDSPPAPALADIAEQPAWTIEPPQEMYTLQETLSFPDQPGNWRLHGWAWDVAGNVAHTVTTIDMREAETGVYAWGSGFELGDGVGEPAADPVVVRALPAVAAMTAGDGMTLAMDDAGVVYRWGDPDGKGPAGSTAVPEPVAGLPPAVQFDAGDAFAIVLAEDGQVYAWGENAYGQLGNSGLLATDIPQRVDGPAGVVAIAAGRRHALALDALGQLWAWGANDCAQLGIGSADSDAHPVPVKSTVPGLENIGGLAAGEGHSLILKRDGTVWAWGCNASGQLGDGSRGRRAVVPAPVRVLSLTGIVQVAAGRQHSLALTHDGRVFGWGDGLAAGCGDGSGAPVGVPGELAALNDVTAVAAGARHSLALTADGRVFGWGDNSRLAVWGDDERAAILSPRLLPSLSGVTLVAAGLRQSLVAGEVNPLLDPPVSSPQAGFGLGIQLDETGAVSLPSLGIETDAYTVELWVVPEAAATDASSIVFLAGDDAQDRPDGYALRIREGVFEHAVPGVGTVTGTTKVVPGRAYHVAMTGTGGTPAEPGRLALYVDGMSEGLTLDVTQALPAETARLVLAQNVTDPETYQRFPGFSGILDDIRVWDHVRSAEEVRADLAADAVPPFPDGLRAYYPCNDGGTVLTDAVSGTHSGEFAGVDPRSVYRESRVPVRRMMSPGGLVDPPLFGWDAQGDALVAVITQTPGYGTITADDRRTLHVGDVAPLAGLAYAPEGEPRPDSFSYRVRDTQADADSDQDARVDLVPANTPPLAGFGGMLQFDGTGAGILIDNPAPNDFTIEFWMRATMPDDPSATHWENGVGLVDGSAPGEARDVGIALAGGRLLFGAGAPDTTISSGFVADGRWHFVAATRETHTGTMRLHVDAMLVAETVGSPGARIDADQLCIGARRDGDGAFEGELDELRIWDVVRPPGAYGVAGDRWKHSLDDYDLPPRAAYFCNTSPDDVLPDDSGNGFHGAIDEEAPTGIGWTPSTIPLRIEITAESPVSFALFGYDADPDTALTYSVLDGVGHGTLTAPDADGRVTYAPGAGFRSLDRFTCAVSDGLDESTVPLEVVLVRADPPEIPTSSLTIWGGHGYLLVSDQYPLGNIGALTWPEARDVAEWLGGYLVVIAGAPEHGLDADAENALIGQIVDARSAGDTYIGLEQTGPGVEGWRWINGEAYSVPAAHWNWGEPNNINEEYGEFYQNSHVWNDENGTWLQSFVVEFDSPPQSNAAPLAGFGNALAIQSLAQRATVPDIGPASGDLVSYTVELWMRPDREGPATLVSLGDGRALVVSVDVAADGVERWEHIALVVDGESRRLYRNGVLSQVYQRPAVALDGELHIGWPDSPAGFTGLVDEIRVWRGARTRDALDDGMGGRITGEAADGLMLYLPCDDIREGMLRDVSGRGLHADLVGFDTGQELVPGGLSSPAIDIVRRPVQLFGWDPEGDPLSFTVTGYPRHSALHEFDPDHPDEPGSEIPRNERSAYQIPAEHEGRIWFVRDENSEPDWETQTITYTVSDWDGVSAQPATILVHPRGPGESYRVGGDQYNGHGGPWTRFGSPYIVTDNVTIPPGRTLTVEAGVTIFVEEDCGITVDGTLVAESAEPDQPILFTSALDAPAPGDWRAIRFNAGSTGRLAHCTVQYGGDGGSAWGRANLTIRGPSDVVLTDCTFMSAAEPDSDRGWGVRVEDAADPRIERCLFAGNRRDAAAFDLDCFPVLQGNRARQNGRWNGFALIDGHVDRTGTWYADSVPYVLDADAAASGNIRVEQGATLTIQPGTVVKAEQESGEVKLDVFGTLLAQGTADAPILFTSSADDDLLEGSAPLDSRDTDGADIPPEAGDWEGIFFNPESTGSVLRHCILRYGGQDRDPVLRIMTSGVELANCVVSTCEGDGIALFGTTVTLTDIVVRDAGYDGFWIRREDGRDSDVTLVRCTADGCRRGVAWRDGGTVVSLTQCTILNNGEVGIDIEDGTGSVSDSDFAGNPFALRNRTGDCIDATGCAWGHADGPYDPDDDADPDCPDYNDNPLGQQVSNHVIYRPWKGVDPDVQQGLLAHWPFDRIEENRGEDLSGRGALARLGWDGDNVQPDAVPAQVPNGDCGNALRFDGGDYVATPVTPTDLPVTLCAWVWPEQSAYTGSWMESIVDCDRDGVGGFGFGMARDEFRVFHGKDYQALPYAVRLQQWQHVAVVFSDAGYEAFIDGASLGPAAHAYDADFDPVSFMLGKSPAANLFFRGALDDVRIYGSALPADAIAQIAGACLPAFPTGGTPPIPIRITAPRQTATVDIDLELEAEDDQGIAAVAFSETPEPDPQALVWTPWPNPGQTTAIVPHTIAGDDGSHTVYAWYRDAQGAVNTMAGDGVEGVNYAVIDVDTSGAEPVEVCGEISNQNGGPWVGGTTYVVTCDVVIPKGQTLTVEPGATIRFQWNTVMHVYGRLQALGNETERILFTSDAADPAPGNWQTIAFHNDGDASELRHCVVEYGGAGEFAANLFVEGAPATRFEQVDSRLSAAHGILIRSFDPDNPRQQDGDETPAQPVLEECRFVDNAGDAVFLEAGCYPEMSGLTAFGNDVNAVHLRGLDSGVWHFRPGGTLVSGGIPYLLRGVVRDVPEGETLEIEPGTVIKCDGVMTLRVLGTLRAGDPDNPEADPVVFTSWCDDAVGGDTFPGSTRTPRRGDWTGIRFDPGSDGNALVNCQFRYGGGWGVPSLDLATAAFDAFGPGSIRESATHAMRCDNAAPAEIRDWEFRNGSGAGLHITGGDVDNVLVTASLFSGNRWGIEIWGDADLSVTDSRFDGNAEFGILNHTGRCVFAPDNAWGDPGGPRDTDAENDLECRALNPDSAGDEVSENVMWMPPVPGTETAADMLLHYAFDDDAGATVEDRSGNGNDAVARETRWTADGGCGGALRFSAIDQAHTRTPQPGYKPYGSAEMWVRFTELPPSPEPEHWSVFTVAPTSVDGRFDQLVIGTDSSETGSRNLCFGIYTHGTGWNYAASDVEPSLDWMHLAATWGPDGLVFYIDGTEAGRHPYGDGLPESPDYAVYLGCNTHNGFVNAVLDEVRLYGRVLDGPEIRRHSDVCRPTRAPDPTPPTVLATVPVQDAAAVPADSSIEIVFDRDIAPGPAFGGVGVTVDDQWMGQVFAAQVDPDRPDTLVLVGPDTLRPLTRYEVVLPPDSVVSLTGIGLAEEFRLAFDTDVGAPSSHASHAVIAAVGSTVHLAYLDDRRNRAHYDLYYRRSDDNGLSWGADRLVVDAGIASFADPQLVAHGTTVCISYARQDFREESSSIQFSGYKLAVSQDDGATWSTQGRTLPAEWSGAHQLLLLPGPRLAYMHLSESANRNRRLELRESPDLGDNWDNWTHVLQPADVQGYRATVDSDVIHLVYAVRDHLGRYQLFYANDRFAWGAVRAHLGTGCNPVVTVTDDGSVHIVFTQEDDGVSHLYYRRSSNGWHWTPAEQLTSSGIADTVPALSSRGDDVYLTWCRWRADARDVRVLRRTPDAGWSAETVAAAGFQRWHGDAAPAVDGVHLTSRPNRNAFTYVRVADPDFDYSGFGWIAGMASSEGNALCGVTMQLRQQVIDSAHIDTVTTDSDGRFLFSRVPPGTYWLTPELPNATFADSRTTVTVNAGLGTVANVVTTEPAVGDGFWETQFHKRELTLRDVCAADALRGWAVGTDTEDGSMRPVILHTADGGAVWTLAQLPAFPDMKRPSAVHFLSADVGWVGGDADFLLKTTDGGNTWLRQTLPDVRHSVTNVVFRNAQNGVATGPVGYLAWTDDGGATWNEVPAHTLDLPGTCFDHLIDVGFFNDNALWAMGEICSNYGCSGGCRTYFSFDAGKTWDTTRNRPTGLMAMDYLDTRLGMAAGWTALRTEDGTAWNDAEYGRTQDRPRDLDVVTTDTAWMVGTADDVYYHDYGAMIQITRDGGRSWTLQPCSTDQQLAALHMASERNGWAVGSRGVILRYDGTGSLPAAVSGAISGRVLDRVAGRGLDGVTVAAVRENGVPVRTNTNDLGMFTLRDLEPGTYTVSIEPGADAAPTGITGVDVVAGQTATADLETFVDSDGDLIADNWEIQHFHNLIDAGPGTDADNDGLHDIDEFENNTDPHATDTDTDGMGDAYEVNHDLDPRDNGTLDQQRGPQGNPDGDALSNLRESELGTDPWGNTPAVAVNVSIVGNGTVVSDPPGISCPESCEALFATNAPLVLTAVAPVDVAFTEWTGDENAALNPLQLIPEDDFSVTAHFGPGPATANAMQPDLAFTTDGELYLAYTDKRQERESSGIYVRRSDDRGETWTPDVKAASSAHSEATYNQPQLAVIPGIVRVLYHRWYGTHFAGYGMVESADRGQTWSEPRSLPGNLNAQPKLLADAVVPDRLDLFQLSGSDDGELFRYRSTDGGQTWTPREWVTACRHGYDRNEIRTFDVARTTDGTCHVVYEDRGRIYYTTDRWPFGAEDRELAEGENPAITVDADGYIHVAYQQGNASLAWRISRNNGHRWEPAYTDTQAGISWRLRPHLSAWESDVCLAWAAATNGTAQGAQAYGIRYASGTGWTPIRCLTGEPRGSRDALQTGEVVNSLAVGPGAVCLAARSAEAGIRIANADADLQYDQNWFVIAGRVSAAGQPLCGVTVTLSRPGCSRTTTTDPDGRYHFGGLPEANFVVVPSLGTTDFTPATYQTDVPRTDLDFTAEDDTVGDGWWTVQHWRPGLTLHDVTVVSEREIWATGSLQGVGGAILHSTDAGENWTTITAQDAPISSDLLGLDFPDSRNGWFVGKFGTALQTRDAGTTWDRVRWPGGFGFGGALRGVAFFDSCGWILGTPLIRTRDGGVTWEQLPRDLIVTDDGNDDIAGEIGFFNRDAGWITGNRETGQDARIHITFDGGETWPHAVRAPRGLTTFTFFDTCTGVGAGRDVLLFTRDGATLTVRDREGGAPVITRPRQAVMPSAIHAWIVGSDWTGANDAEAGVALVTFNGGQTWTRQPLPTCAALRKTAFLNPRAGWAVGENGVILKYTGTGSWQGQRGAAISGRVTDGATGNGVAGADVRTSRGQQAVTNAFGLYTIHDVPNGTCLVTAEKPGFGNVTETCVLRNKKVTLNIDNAAGLQQWQPADADLWEDTEGTLVMNGTGTGTLARTTYASHICDVDVTLRISKTDGNAAAWTGMMIRETESHDAGYRFVINAEGGVEVSRVNAGEVAPCSLLPGADHAVNRGLGLDNVLRVRAVGTILRFFVNTVPVCEWQDATFACGTLSLVAEDTGDAVPADRVVFEPTALFVPARELAFVVQPASTGLNEAFDVAVAVVDETGMVAVNHEPVIATLSIAPGADAAGATLSGTVTRATKDGVAVFPGLSIDRAAQGYRLQADAEGIESGQSNAFSVTGLIGDVNDDGKVDLVDAVLSMQVVAGMTPPGVRAGADVNGDGRIGMPEAVYALRQTAGVPPDSATAEQKTEEANAALQQKDYATAKALYAQALQANPDNPQANAGYSVSVVAENAPVFNAIMQDIMGMMVTNDLHFGGVTLGQMFGLAAKLPFYALSASAGRGAYEIDIDLQVANGLKESVLRVKHGVSTVDSGYFSVLQDLASRSNQYRAQILFVLPFIRKAQEADDLALELPADVFRDAFGYDIDGDGINDLDPPGDRICLDQGDMFLLDAVLSVVLGVGEALNAYDFNAHGYAETGDANEDGYADPDEYLPPPPYYTLTADGPQHLDQAYQHVQTAVAKARTGLDITLAETQDVYEILPVNSDPDLRTFVHSLRQSTTYTDVTDAKAALAGPYNMDFAKGPFYLQGVQATIDLSRFFTQPRDLRDMLPRVNLESLQFEPMPDPTFGGIFPDGDLVAILNEALHAATLQAIPVITGMSADTVEYGDTVVLIGSGFGETQADSIVIIDTTTLSEEAVTAWSDSEIAFTMPHGLLPGRLRVTVDGIRSNSRRINVEGLTIDTFDETEGARPEGNNPKTLDSGLLVYSIHDVPDTSGFWNDSQSDWAVRQSTLQQFSNIYRVGAGGTDPQNGDFRGSNILTKYRTAGNGTVTAQIKTVRGTAFSLLDSDDDGVGVIVRYRDEDNFYRFFVQRDEDDNGPFARLEKWVDGNLTVLGLSTDPDHIYSDEPDATTRITVNMQGSRLRAYLNEILVFDLSDGTFTGGHFGLSVYAMEGLYVDYLLLQE